MVANPLVSETGVLVPPPTAVPMFPAVSDFVAVEVSPTSGHEGEFRTRLVMSSLPSRTPIAEGGLRRLFAANVDRSTHWTIVGGAPVAGVVVNDAQLSPSAASTQFRHLWVNVASASRCPLATVRVEQMPAEGCTVGDVFGASVMSVPEAVQGV